MHKHKCGLTALGQLEGLGCGHIWAHETGTLADHYCPQCGAGPFTFHYEETNKPTSMEEGRQGTFRIQASGSSEGRLR